MFKSTEVIETYGFQGNVLGDVHVDDGVTFVYHPLNVLLLDISLNCVSANWA